MQMLGGQLDKTKIPAGLPAGAKVYNKTGATSKLTHDVAIVEASGRRYALSILTERAPGGNTWKSMAGLTADLHTALGR
jgi:beta-lactamase class A